MKLTFEQCNEILQSLPIGYYFGDGLNVTLTNEQDTYIDLVTKNIYVSYPTIAKIISKLNDTTNLYDIEQVIRGLLYHEVSHAILTPKYIGMTSTQQAIIDRLLNQDGISLNPNYDKIKNNLYNTCNSIFNIFEDERIETILKNYYLNVNFKKNTYLINGLDYNKPTELHPNQNPESAFFNLVRFRQYKNQGLVDEVEKIIKKYPMNQLNHNCDQDIGDPVIIANNYLLDIFTLYLKILLNDFENLPELSEIIDKQNSNDSESPMIEQTEETNQDVFDQINQQIKDIIYISSYNKQEIYQFKHDIELAILAHINKMKNKSGAISSYIGKINPRLVATKNNFKWFNRQNIKGEHATYNKLNLTLYIDTSGSFIPNIKKMSDAVFVLRQIEKQYSKIFNLNIITINTKFELLDKKITLLDAGGGNKITKKLYEISKTCIDPNADNYSIVVFDGDCVSDQHYYYTREDFNQKLQSEIIPGLKTFNNVNTIIVSDLENQKLFKKYLIKPRIKYIEENYCESFLKEITNLFTKLI